MIIAKTVLFFYLCTLHFSQYMFVLALHYISPSFSQDNGQSYRPEHHLVESERAGSSWSFRARLPKMVALFFLFYRPYIDNWWPQVWSLPVNQFLFRSNCWPQQNRSYGRWSYDRYSVWVQSQDKSVLSSSKSSFTCCWVSNESNMTHCSLL